MASKFASIIPWNLQRKRGLMATAENNIIILDCEMVSIACWTTRCHEIASHKCSTNTRKFNASVTPHDQKLRRFSHGAASSRDENHHPRQIYHLRFPQTNLSPNHETLSLEVWAGPARVPTVCSASVFHSPLELTICAINMMERP